MRALDCAAARAAAGEAVRTALGARVRAAVAALALTAAMLSAAACRAERPWELVPAPALDLPAAFRIDGPETPGAVIGCPGRLVDPRDQSALRLRRSIASGAPSGGGLGDYAVSPRGRYGGDDTTLLRVDCGARRGLGLVPARAP